MSGLYLMVNPLHFCSWSHLRMVDCDTFTPALRRLLAMSLTVVLGFFFTALTMFCLQLLMFPFVFVQGLLPSTPVVSFFFGTVQMVALALVSVCEDFPASHSFKIARLFSHTQLSVLQVGYTFININAVFKGKTQNWTWEQTFNAIYCLNIECNTTQLGSKTHLSGTSSNNFAHFK